MVDAALSHLIDSLVRDVADFPKEGVTFKDITPLLDDHAAFGAVVQGLADEIGADLVPMGSAGAKVISVVRDVSDAYVHAGGMYEWDSAAPVAVARAAGLHTSRLDGSPLRYNQPDPHLPDLLVCRPELADRLLGVLGELSGT